MQNAEIARYENGMKLQCQTMELHQASHLTDQTRREKSWLCDELERRDRALQGDRARNCQEIEELQRICCTDAETAQELRSDELKTRKEEGKSAVKQLYGSDSGIARQGECFERRE